MLFSQTNDLALFQEMIYTIFKDMKACIWYLFNILIYSSNTEAEHQAVLEKVLQEYVKHVLVDTLFQSKCHIHETMFLMHVIKGQEVKLDLSKHKTMSK